MAERIGSNSQNANIVQSTDLYDAFGNRTSAATVQPDPFGYEAQAGYYTDTETGLLLLTHRYYDPAQGRFLTRDPMGPDGGINLYSYTANNPTNDWDPEGYQPGRAGGKPPVAPGAKRKDDPTWMDLAQQLATLDPFPEFGPRPPDPPRPTPSSRRAPVKEAGLPTRGPYRYIAPKGWKPGTPLPRGRGGGFLDKFKNEWQGGQGHPNHHFPDVINPETGQPYPFEWDVQHPDGTYSNVCYRVGIKR